MPLSQDAAQEVERMEQYGQDLADPRKARIAALKLEGIGRRASETLKQALSSADPDVRFFAAESLAYMDDGKAAETLAQSARSIPEYRAHALTALSSLDEPISPLKLHELMADSNSVELRYGAFRALRVLDPEDLAITGESVGDRMFLHQVVSSGTPFIHVSSRDRAEIVLFGRELRFETPLVLKAGNKITLMAEEGSDQVTIRRFARGEPVRQYAATLNVRDVVRKAVALGATYPDIVGMLLQASRQHNLPGRLEVDQIPDPLEFVARLQRISNQPTKATENVAMPNLFRWTDSRKSAKDRPSDEGDESKETVKSTEATASKPSLLKRAFGRTAN
jgi:hypothetical protein